jgi:DNA-directed RNA polymerase subunit F
MKEKENIHNNIPKNNKEENQDTLEHFNKKRKLQNKALEKMIENLNKLEKKNSRKK